MGLQHSDPFVVCKSLCHTVDAATTLHLELFQMAAPLYVSGLLTKSHLDWCQSLHRRNSLRRTLHHFHNRETFP